MFKLSLIFSLLSDFLINIFQFGPTVRVTGQGFTWVFFYSCRFITSLIFHNIFFVLTCQYHLRNHRSIMVLIISYLLHLDITAIELIKLMLELRPICIDFIQLEHYVPRSYCFDILNCLWDFHIPRVRYLGHELFIVDFVTHKANQVIHQSHLCRL